MKPRKCGERTHMALTKDPATINNIVQATGCITVSQVSRIFPAKNDKAIHALLGQLYNQKYISFIENDYIVPYRKGESSRESILCTWVMLDQNEEANVGINISTELNMIHQSEFPAQFIYVHDNKLCEICYIYEGNTANLQFLQRTVQQRITEEGMEDYQCIIVVEDTSVIEKIEAINFAIPIIIAHVKVNGELFREPDIEYYK